MKGDSASQPDQASIQYATSERADSHLTIGNVAVLAVRLFAFYCLLQAMPLLFLVPALALMTTQGLAPTAPDWVYYLLQGLAPAVYLAVGILLLARTGPIALWALGIHRNSHPAEATALRAPGRALHAMAFSVVGVILLVLGVGQFAGVVADGLHDIELVGRNVATTIVRQNLSGLLQSLIKIGAGVWLFLGSNRLAWYWRHTRMQEPRRSPFDIHRPSRSGGR